MYVIKVQIWACFKYMGERILTMQISPVSIYSSFGTASLGALENPAYLLIKKQLKELGIKPTGNLQTDKILLERAQSEQSTQKTGSTKEYNPWNDIMAKLGLSPTGNRTEDYDLIIKTLDNWISRTSNETDIAYYEELKQDTENAFAIDYSSKNNMTGTNYMGELNRLMMVNIRK